MQKLSVLSVLGVLVWSWVVPEFFSIQNFMLVWNNIGSDQLSQCIFLCNNFYFLNLPHQKFCTLAMLLSDFSISPIMITWHGWSRSSFNFGVEDNNACSPLCKQAILSKKHCLNCKCCPLSNLIVFNLLYCQRSFCENFLLVICFLDVWPISWEQWFDKIFIWVERYKNIYVAQKADYPCNNELTAGGKLRSFSINNMLCAQKYLVLVTSKKS